MIDKDTPIQDLKSINEQEETLIVFHFQKLYSSSNVQNLVLKN